jgi:hypothetical protein
MLTLLLSSCAGGGFGGNINVTRTNSGLQFSEGSTMMAYSWKGGRTIDGHVYQFGQHDTSMKEGAVFQDIFLITPSQHQHVLSKYKSVKRCPASYINKHMQVYLLLSDDPEMIQAFHSTNPTKGDRLYMEGYVLEFANGSSNGSQVRMPGGRHSYFYPSYMAIGEKEYRANTLSVSETRRI